MKGAIWEKILEFLRKHMVDRRWRRVVTCLAAAVVFCTTYALILPAISMTKTHPSLSAETLTAWSGDRLTVRVDAYAEEGKGDRTIVLLTEGEGADLSPEYVFEEDGTCVITDAEAQEILLHRAVGENSGKETVYYWFTLGEGEKTKFTLDLLDEESEARAAMTAALMKRAAEQIKAENAAAAGDAGKATASDAARADGKDAADAGRATASDAVRAEVSEIAAEKRVSAENATASDAGRRAAVVRSADTKENAAAKASAANADLTEEHDDGFTELLDGAIVNDLEADPEEDGEVTEIVASLKLSAGFGADESEAFRDAARNADKRGDAQLMFKWKDSPAGREVTPEMFWAGEGAQVVVKFDGDAKLPEGAVLSVEEIPHGSPEYAEYLARSQGAVITPENSTEAERGVNFARFFDISILDADGNEVEPAAPVRVVITCDEGIRPGRTDDVNVLHFKEELAPEVLAAETVSSGVSGSGAVSSGAAGSGTDAVDGSAGGSGMSGAPAGGADAVSFTTDSFSVFGVVTTTIEKVILAGDGSQYRVTVTCGPASGIPEGAGLEVREILPEETEEYKLYSEKAMEALGWEERSLSYARFFDISIIKDGEKLQPAAGTRVNVQVRLDDKAEGTVPQVVHFAEAAEVLSASTNGDTVFFEAGGFSVYAIVDAPEPVTKDSIKSLEELEENLNQKMYLSCKGNHFFTSNLNNKDCFIETVNAASASFWYFEKVGGQENQYCVYTYVDGEKQYMHNKSGNLMELSTETGTPFALSEINNGKFYFMAANENKWLQHSNGGGGIRLYTDNNNAENSQITISCATLPDDTYSLDKKSFGIAYHNDSATSAALTAESRTVVVNKVDQSRLAATDMLMRPDVLDHDGILLVAEGSDIQEWTFRCIEENKYYITTEADGVTKYLTISGGNVTLSDAPDEINSVITATPGTGSNSGKWHFTVNGYSLNLPDGASGGFNAATGSGDTTWMNLVEKSVLSDDDFRLYTAKKVSVSDTVTVCDGQQVVLYTRIWNDSTKKYEFYAVDHDGTLIRCYDTGDGIEWIGTKVNTELWTFTEGTNYDGSRSYYYWLQNTQYGNYLVPQAVENTVSYETDEAKDPNASVNLNGRRYGENYTTIIAWDDAGYSYSGLKTENGRVAACALSEADDFYFAILQPREELTRVDTVDSAQYGITMKMVDFNNDIQSKRDSGQTAIMGLDTNTFGLVTTDIKENGYPDTVSSETNKDTASLGDLFVGASEVNHLFIQSIYNESGYFEFDSTQNFAHLNNDGTFTVYDQIGSISDYGGITGQHGQFLPYDEITAGSYCPHTNMTSVLAEELSDMDPRKGEKLFNIGSRDSVDYFFGMEMEASFTQTPSGLDAWGHDIIFEFSGDDDFWLYVDGELILDVGGVHAASIGNINFRTGEVEVKIRDKGGKTVRSYNKTLRELFKEHYKEKNPEASEEDTDAYLNGIFKDGGTVFTDYSNHTMRMFYMERGAGASNLHMRFNLAAVKPGTVELSKKLSGTVSASNNLIEFPYQVYYFSKEDQAYHLLTSDRDGTADFAVYKDTVRNVTYKKSYTSADGTSFSDVLFLKPGETAVISLPEGAEDYYIVECAVNTDVYDTVTANGIPLSGREDTKPQDTEDADDGDQGGRKNFSTAAASSINRPSVEYDNHVADGAMRTLNITKLLYDTDGVTPLHYDVKDDDEAPKGKTKDDLEDKTVFGFRLYLGNENADPANLAGAYLYPYYVKNRDNYYCRWDASVNRFVSLGINDFDQLQTYLERLPAAERETVVFTTSPNGSISKIPADYTVEVRDLVIGTRWKVMERDGEIPRGYTRRESDGYARTDTAPVTEQADPVSGTMAKDESPEVQVRNQRGWGLTVNKNWTDKDFMLFHDTIYFAVYVHDSGDNRDYYAQVPEYMTITRENADGTTTTETVIDHYKPAVRQLTTGNTELYYFFGDLHNNTEKTYQFSDYFVRELSITAPEGTDIEVDADGYVTNLDSGLTVTPIDPDGTLTTGGTPVGGDYQDDLSYTVSYVTGSSTGANENIRTDTVTNSRPGIELYKTDWTGKWTVGTDGKNSLEGALSGARFTLKDSGGGYAAAPVYISGSDGLITTAYLSPGTYTLAETATPKGYVGLDYPIIVTVGEDGVLKFRLQTGDESFDEITVSPGEEGTPVVIGSSIYFSVQKRADSNMTATVTIKNRSNALKVLKTGPDSEAGGTSGAVPLAGAHFALYRQVRESDGTPRKDYNPMTGYDDLVTGADGIPAQTVTAADGSTKVNRITMDLPAGTYYLTETQPPDNYRKLSEDIIFTIGAEGTVTVSGAAHAGWLTSETDTDAGTTLYTLSIPNDHVKDFDFCKVWLPVGSSMETQPWQKDITVTLYKGTGTDADTKVAHYVIRMTEDGLKAVPFSDILGQDAPEIIMNTSASEDYIYSFTIKDLPYDDTFYLVESEMDMNLIRYGKQGTEDPVEVVPGAEKAEPDTPYIINRNTGGYELPSTGGKGTRHFTILGFILIAGAGLLLLRRRSVI